MSDESPTIRPNEAAVSLGIPPSTLRTYAHQFRAILSPSAGAEMPAGGSGFRHRRYSDADLVILRRAMALLDDGLSYRAVLARLGRDSSGTQAGRSERRRQSRPALSTTPAAKTRPGVPRLGPDEAGSVRIDVPFASSEAQSPTGQGELQRPPRPRGEEDGLIELNRRLSNVEKLVIEQSAAWERMAGDVSAIVFEVQGLRDQLSRLTPFGTDPTSTEPPARRGWLARLFGLDPK